jgi:hypothetical protein
MRGREGELEQGEPLPLRFAYEFSVNLSYVGLGL